MLSTRTPPQTLQNYIISTRWPRPSTLTITEKIASSLWNCAGYRLGTLSSQSVGGRDHPIAARLRLADNGQGAKKTEKTIRNH